MESLTDFFKWFPARHMENNINAINDTYEDIGTLYAQRKFQSDPLYTKIAKEVLATNALDALESNDLQKTYDNMEALMHGPKRLNYGPTLNTNDAMVLGNEWDNFLQNETGNPIERRPTPKSFIGDLQNRGFDLIQTLDNPHYTINPNNPGAPYVAVKDLDGRVVPEKSFLWDYNKSINDNLYSPYRVKDLAGHIVDTSGYNENTNWQDTLYKGYDDLRYKANDYVGQKRDAMLKLLREIIHGESGKRFNDKSAAEAYEELMKQAVDSLGDAKLPGSAVKEYPNVVPTKEINPEEKARLLKELGKAAKIALPFLTRGRIK